jgi:hypothetical protein
VDAGAGVERGGVNIGQRAVRLAVNDNVAPAFLGTAFDPIKVVTVKLHFPQTDAVGYDQIGGDR